MITYAKELLVSYDLQLPINLVAHSLIFMGALWVAWANHTLPKWLTTCLWYIGLTACFNAVSIVLQYVIGPEFPLSYWNISLLGETMLNVAVAITAVALLCDVVRKNKM